jgi:hypothetical protein
MLGSVSGGEDVVQEGLLCLHRAREDGERHHRRRRPGLNRGLSSRVVGDASARVVVPLLPVVSMKKGRVSTVRLDSQS